MRCTATFLPIALVFTTAGAFGQAPSYPARPIRLIVPFAPGSGTDIVARTLAPKLSESMGQQVVVDNRSGAGGIIGTDIVAKAAPEGYTILFALSSHAINASLFKKLPYDTRKDFAPVTQLISGPLLLVANPALPVSSAKELIAYVKSKPGQLSYASGGIGSPPHLAGELFRSMTGLDLVHVPFSGGLPALTATVGGQTALYFAGTASAMPFVKPGRLKGLAVTGKTRSSMFPDTPTLHEVGVSGYEIDQWYAILATAGTPRPVIARLHAEFAKALKAPDTRERLLGMGVEPVGSTPEAFAAYLAADIEKYAKVVKASGARVD
jgi:tripartite-type tricarboxylate transporter receptor subunit TctC